MLEYTPKSVNVFVKVILSYIIGFYALVLSYYQAFLFRFGLRDGICRSHARMDHKTVVITGGETGIGKETARELSKRGARIVMGSFDYETGLKTAAEISSQTKNEVVVHKLDLGSIATIRKFAKKVLDTEPKIHVLINNAAIIGCPEWRTEDGFEMQFGVNFLGHFLLTNLLLDRLKESKPARVISLSSVGHYGSWIHFDDLYMSDWYEPMASYVQSKLALLMMSTELAERTKGTGVTTYAVDPGLTGRTRATTYLLQSHGWFLLPLVWISKQSLNFMKTPQEGCQTSLHCAVDENAGKESGLFYSDCAPRTPSWISRNKTSQKRLWEIASQMVHLEAQKKMVMSS